MTLISKSKKLFLIGFLLAYGLTNTQAHAATVLSDSPTGLVETTDFTTPASLYVPDHFKKASSRAMLIVIPGSQNYNEIAAAWQTFANAKNILIAVPGIMVRDEDVPYQTDAWLLKFKDSIAMRYNVQRVYVAGFGISADYAAYLGLKQPEAFAAVASVGGSWTGPFEKLTKLSKDASKQTPFFIALKENDERVAKTQEKIKEMTAKGYTVRLAMLNKKDEEESDSFRADMYSWFEEQSIKNATVRGLNQNKKTMKQKVSKVVDDFFAV